MKAVVCGDAHGDWSTLGVPRFDEVARAMDFSVDVAIRERASFYVFTGDLAETEGPGMLRTLQHAVYCAQRLWTSKVQSFWLTGNHDVIEDGLCTSNLSPIRDVHGASLIDRPCVISVVDANGPSGGGATRCCTLAFLPFVPRSHGYDPAAFVRGAYSLSDDAPRLVAGHLMLEGIGPGSETRDMPRGRDVFLPLKTIRECWPQAVLVGGHYHEKQVYRGVHLPGSLARLTKAEAHNEPSLLVVDL